MNGSRLIAGCFRFIFGSRYAESTHSKFGVSAYSRINTVLYITQSRHLSWQNYILCYILKIIMQKYAFFCVEYYGFPEAFLKISYIR